MDTKSNSVRAHPDIKEQRDLSRSKNRDTCDGGRTNTYATDTESFPYPQGRSNLREKQGHGERQGETGNTPGANEPHQTSSISRVIRDMRVKVIIRHYLGDIRLKNTPFLKFSLHQSDPASGAHTHSNNTQGPFMRFFFFFFQGNC